MIESNQFWSTNDGKCSKRGYEFDTSPKTGETHCGGCYSRIIFDREQWLKYRRERYMKNLDKNRARNREYYAENRDRIREMRKKNYAKNIDEMREKERIRRSKNPDRVKRWREANRARVLEYKRNVFRRKKAERVAVLGGKCQICGYNECIAALTLHHKDSNEKDREKDWLRKDLDPSKYLLLCANCHLKLHWEDKSSS